MKDMLTWEDIATICRLSDQVRLDFCDNPKSLKVEPITQENFRKVFFGEVLRRYNELKNK